MVKKALGLTQRLLVGGAHPLAGLGFAGTAFVQGFDQHDKLLPVAVADHFAVLIPAGLGVVNPFWGDGGDGADELVGLCGRQQRPDTAGACLHRAIDDRMGVVNRRKHIIERVLLAEIFTANVNNPAHAVIPVEYCVMNG